MPLLRPTTGHIAAAVDDHHRPEKRGPVILEESRILIIMNLQTRVHAGQVIVLGILLILRAQIDAILLARPQAAVGPLQQNLVALLRAVGWA